jgi:nondiscriminating glutamyl-tRNA synthetase
MSSSVRVRFAPAPTGMMHLGNVRQALINFLFAQQKKGIFVLRIEDTDMQRMFDEGAEHISKDLAWLGITYDEGPGIEGPYGPYFQSKRTSIYAEYLEKLRTTDHIYRCFCSAEDLERKRKRQIELKRAPRYDRACLHLSTEAIQEKLAANIPFVWRFKLPAEKVVVNDLVRGKIEFDLSNFSDFPITRQDGSFTFIFANCVDDITMHMTHIFRGEDHQSNSASQIAVYNAFGAQVPLFWHTPIMCNREGKKLSKRDFGFSLDDLRTAGFVPEAIINYLASIGSKTEKQEIMTVAELVDTIDFTHHSATSTIRYDEDKLRWMNHEWIKRLPLATVAERSRPFLERNYPDITTMSAAELMTLLGPLHQELTALADAVQLLHGRFHTPAVDKVALEQHGLSRYQAVINDIAMDARTHADPDELIDVMKRACQKHGLPTKQLWSLVRITLTGSAEGTSIKNLLHIIKREDIIERLARLTNLA